MAKVVHRFRWPGRPSGGGPPGFEEPGLVLLFDLDEVPEDPKLSGRPVTMVPPAGEPFELVVTASAMLDRVGLLFARAAPGLIPPGSEIRW
jgi:hypothetical protein